MAASMKALRGTAASGARRAAVVPRAEKEVSCYSLCAATSAARCCVLACRPGYRSAAYHLYVAPRAPAQFVIPQNTVIYLLLRFC